MIVPFASFGPWEGSLNTNELMSLELTHISRSQNKIARATSTIAPKGLATKRVLQEPQR